MGSSSHGTAWIGRMLRGRIKLQMTEGRRGTLTSVRDTTVQLPGISRGDGGGRARERVRGRGYGRNIRWISHVVHERKERTLDIHRVPMDVRLNVARQMT
eukprot:7734219-Pyramimonas_sp.AAC.1